MVSGDWGGGVPTASPTAKHTARRLAQAAAAAAAAARAANDGGPTVAVGRSTAAAVAAGVTTHRVLSAPVSPACRPRAAGWGVASATDQDGAVPLWTPRANGACTAGALPAATWARHHRVAAVGCGGWAEGGTRVPATMRLSVWRAIGEWAGGPPCAAQRAIAVATGGAASTVGGRPPSRKRPCRPSWRRRL